MRGVAGRERAEGKSHHAPSHITGDLRIPGYVSAGPTLVVWLTCATQHYRLLPPLYFKEFLSLGLFL